MSFAARLIDWQRRAGRNDLPWQNTSDPYPIWLAEIMLQQTQVGTVIPYFERFLARFPDVDALAAAGTDDVLALWAGLGYYSRARNLHRAARVIAAAGGFPRDRAGLEALPGVGRSTAAAIAAFAFGQREAILDGNVKRVLARHFAIAGYPGERAVATKLWALADSLLPPAAGIAAYTQALMDLGATLCTLRKPRCDACPVRASCAALATGDPTEHPAPRPRKALPHRTTTMLILRDGTDVLLVKRPPAGIWGGLWSLPEIAASDAPAATAQRRFGCRIVDAGAVRALDVVKHGFTHFTLDIRPIVATVARRAGAAAEPGAVWLALDDARRAALPAPVKRIVDALD